jgi:O-glycosyl hydrolase
MASFISRFLAIFIFLIWGCAWAGADTTVVVDPAVRYQTFEGWGVSLAWWAKAVGVLPEAARGEYMEKVFDPVKGLGFNIVRYNIGGGENPDLHVMDVHKEIDGFEPKPGEWNWDADAGQRWVLQQAKAQGVTIFEAFSNSPPYWMTESGSVSGAKNGSQNNLATAHVKDFAEYLATVVQHFKDQEGIEFRTLEPLNESDSNWWHYGGKQEGCHFDRHYQSDVIQAVGRALADRSLTTRISAPDENSVDGALGSYLSYPQETRDLLSQINTHSYNGSKRAELAQAAAAALKILWMSEYGDSDATGMNLSKRIVEDMRQMHPAAWVYWQAVDGPKWGLLTNTPEEVEADPKTGEKYWVMANYTRFIRPGSVFIDINEERSLAALDATGHKLTIVTTNPGDQDEPISYDLSRFDTSHANITAYRTSATENLTSLSELTLTDKSLDVVLPKKSVTTFVMSEIASQAPPASGPLKP